MADERRKFDVSLVTPEGAAFEGPAEMMIVPGAAGEIGVLARHAPLVATLKAGSVRVHLSASEVQEYATGPGFFKEELDRATAARAELDRIEQGESQADRWQIEQRVLHAENQLRAAGAEVEDVQPRTTAGPEHA